MSEDEDRKVARDPVIRQVCIEGTWVNPANVAQTANHGTGQARITYAGGGEQLFNLPAVKVASYLDLVNHTDQTLIIPRGAPIPTPAPTKGKLPPALRAPAPPTRGVAQAILEAPEIPEDKDPTPPGEELPPPRGGLAPGIEPRKRPVPPESQDE